jgi:hypothetical protein
MRDAAVAPEPSRLPGAAGARPGIRFQIRTPGRAIKNRLLVRVVMSASLGAEAPVNVLPVGVNDIRVPSRPVHGRTEAGNPPPSAALACRDVMDEVRNRMAQQGYRWE